MAVYALAIRGPLDKPEGTVYVEVLYESQSPGFYVCRNLISDERVTFNITHLKLIWLNLTKKDI